jgi:hypothetical protein
VPAHLNESRYTYHDHRPPPGVRYYQVVGTDHDGQRSYSGIASVVVPESRGWWLQGRTFHVPEAAPLAAYDATGRLLRHTGHTASQQLSLEGLSGLVLVQYGQQAVRLVLQ